MNYQALNDFGYVRKERFYCANKMIMRYTYTLKDDGSGVLDTMSHYGDCKNEEEARSCVQLLNKQATRLGTYHNGKVIIP